MSTATLHEVLGATAPWTYNFADDERFSLIVSMVGVEQPVRYHPEGDVFNHTMFVLRMVSESTSSFSARLAALLHDVGKTATPRALWPHHYGHDAAGVELARRFMSQFSDVSEEQREFVLATVRCHMAVKHWHEFRESTKARYIATIGSDNMALFGLVCLADGTDLDEIREMVSF
jgi:putative nucleotidyltransferase with HDIG domain